MAKQIIVLHQTQNQSGVQIQAVMWYPVANVADQVAIGQGSVWTGASALENTAIQTGAVIEEINSFSFPPGSSMATLKDVILKTWQSRNTEIIRLNIYYGVFFDGVTGWSA